MCSHGQRNRRISSALSTVDITVTPSTYRRSVVRSTCRTNSNYAFNERPMEGHTMFPASTKARERVWQFAAPCSRPPARTTGYGRLTPAITSLRLTLAGSVMRGARGGRGLGIVSF